MIDSDAGLKAWFIKQDLIAAKLASGRPQDLADASAIQNAMRVQPPKRRGQPLYIVTGNTLSRAALRFHTEIS